MVKGIEYDMVAVPSWYKGVRFKSVLESTCARAFDLFGWEWEYETMRLPGWDIDFVLNGMYKKILVEVKPVISLSKDGMWEVVSKMMKAINDGIDDPRNTVEPMIIGLKPFEYRLSPKSQCIGWIGEWVDNDYIDIINMIGTGFALDEAMIGVVNGKVDFHHCQKSWVGRMTGVRPYQAFTTSDVVNKAWEDAKDGVFRARKESVELERLYQLNKEELK